jgi:peroxiredoxin
MTDLERLPDGLPVPRDDGAADHLMGATVPSLRLPASTSGLIDLASAAQELLVVYVYPRTGKPGEPLPKGWDEIPGARGCTVQACAFRDHVDELARVGAGVIGLSAQSTLDQQEFAEREHVPYPLLSDTQLKLADALGLPTFEVAGLCLYKRLTFIAHRGRIERVFYPVFPPQHNAAEVVAWLQTRDTRTGA